MIKNLRQQLATAIQILLIFCWLLVSCGLRARLPGPIPTSSAWMPTTTGSTAPGITPSSHQEVRAVELAILDNMKTYGFNPDPDINNGLGGLYINWRYGSSPLQVNVNGTGETDEDSGASLRHDELTDLRYLHNLWSYKVENPWDNSFNNELRRYTAIIRYEFADTRNERGWLYDIFMDIYRLSRDSFYRDAALSLVRSYAKAYDPRIGTIYKRNSGSNILGSYRVDNVLESACALIQAGTLNGRDDWIEKGRNILHFLYTYAYMPRYHTFPAQIGPVLQYDGQLDPEQPFYSGTAGHHYRVDGGMVRMGNISQIVISLLDTYKITHERDYLNKAIDLLDPFSLPGNALGMWDSRREGYFYSVSFSGSSPSQPGDASVDTQRKEAGRQAIMLQTYHLADRLTNNRYRVMEKLMLDAALHHIYVSQLHGVTYEVKDDWSFLKFKNGTYNNMVTTEAMGAELESLFSLSQ